MLDIFDLVALCIEHRKSLEFGFSMNDYRSQMTHVIAKVTYTSPYLLQ